MLDDVNRATPAAHTRFHCSLGQCADSLHTRDTCCPGSHLHKLVPCTIKGCVAGEQGPLVVTFMHNIISGHEHTMKAVRSNNTDTGSWQHFRQQCLLIVDMTFDENRFQWCQVNLQAAAAIAQAVHSIAEPSIATPGEDRTTSNANHAA